MHEYKRRGKVLDRILDRRRMFERRRKRRRRRFFSLFIQLDSRRRRTLYGARLRLAELGLRGCAGY